ncbi:hypothetical protein CAEBREN_00291 [Caenorhabditis brenneri]|uniref:Uncharacterized protein n=1 Tax=Caenorhabditis brenneri TaxID=135651 RepID=G0NA17_CAEBE|nr:hypothetical protein CAEBREN_00291 [Caenorhabditis brenneri]
MIRAQSSSTDYSELEMLFSNELSRLYQYSITVKYVFRRPDDREVSFEISKPFNKNPILMEQDRKRCEQVYKKAIIQFKQLRQPGVFLYDRQSVLYSTVQIPNENLSFTITQQFSKHPNFVRAEFLLERDKTTTIGSVEHLHSKNLSLKHILKYGSSNHYTILS